MNFKQLQYFITTVDKHSFTEAAKECFISQAAISQQIRLLEEELNVPLIHRHGCKFSVTPAGKLLYNKAKHISKEMEEITSQVRRVHSNLGSTLRLGLLSSMDKDELTNKLKEDLLIRTGLDLELFYGSHDELYEQFGSGLLNAFISDDTRLSQTESYIKKYLFSTKLYVEIPKTANLSNIQQDMIDPMDMLIGQNLKFYRLNDSKGNNSKLKIETKSLQKFKLFFVCEPVHQQEEERCLNELLDSANLSFTAVDSIQEGRKQILQYQNQILQAELKQEKDSKTNKDKEGEAEVFLENCGLIVDRSLLRGDYSTNPKIFRYELMNKGKSQKRRLCCYARNNLDRAILHELCATLLEYGEKSDKYYEENSLEKDHERANTRRLLRQQDNFKELQERRASFKERNLAI